MRQAVLQIEEYPVYSDFIVYGKKEIPLGREAPNAI